MQCLRHRDELYEQMDAGRFLQIQVLENLRMKLNLVWSPDKWWSLNPDVDGGEDRRLVYPRSPPWFPNGPHWRAAEVSACSERVSPS